MVIFFPSIVIISILVILTEALKDFTLITSLNGFKLMKKGFSPAFFELLFDLKILLLVIKKGFVV